LGIGAMNRKIKENPTFNPGLLLVLHPPFGVSTLKQDDFSAIITRKQSRSVRY
jgi:hypothetical protein